MLASAINLPSVSNGEQADDLVGRVGMVDDPVIADPHPVTGSALISFITSIALIVVTCQTARRTPTSKMRQPG